MNFQDAAAELNETQMKRYGRKLLQNNTYLYKRDENAYAVQLHLTDVVTIRRDGTFVLNSGGWRTPTTKERINNYAPCTIQQMGGIWYVVPASPQIRQNCTNFDYRESIRGCPVFEDGIVVQADGTVAGFRVSDTERYESAKRVIDRLVTKYLKGYIKSVMDAGIISRPSGGDCWGCYMKVQGNPQSEAFGFSHYFEHFKDEYFVPSLFLNAFALTKFGNPAAVFHMMNSDVENGREPFELRNSLRKFFRKLKPDLVKEYLEQQQQQEEEAA